MGAVLPMDREIAAMLRIVDTLRGLPKERQRAVLVAARADCRCLEHMEGAAMCVMGEVFRWLAEEP